jgi:hypothetical protein
MTHELLNGLSSDEAEQVLKLGTRLIAPGGAELFRLGDHADSPDPDRTGPDQAYPAAAGPGPGRGYFRGRKISRSDRGLVGPDSALPFTLTATALLLEAEVIALPREALIEYLAANPAAGYKIALNLAVVIGHRLEMFHTMWLREMQRTVEVRSA